MDILTYAIKVVKQIENIDVYIEQPCETYRDCVEIRKKTSNPFILDESIDSLNNFLQAYRDGAMDIINLKISKLGGIYKSKQIRDLCVELKIPMTIEDSWGGDIAIVMMMAVMLLHLTVIVIAMVMNQIVLGYVEVIMQIMQMMKF